MRTRGRPFAMSDGMSKHRTRHSAVERQRQSPSLRRIAVRLLGASLLSLGFALTILLIGIPAAMSMWLAHGSSAWIARAVGGTSGVGEAFVWTVSTAAGVLLTALAARVVYGLVRRAVSDGRQTGAPDRSIVACAA